MITEVFVKPVTATCYIEKAVGFNRTTDELAKSFIMQCLINELPILSEQPNQTTILLRQEYYLIFCFIHREKSLNLTFVSFRVYSKDGFIPDVQAALVLLDEFIYAFNGSLASLNLHANA